MLARFRDENATVISGFGVPGVLLAPDVESVPSTRTHLLQLHDGRQLGWSEYGARHGYPILYMHREGSCRLDAGFFDRFARQAGFRLIAMDRPGLGASDYAVMDSAEQLARDHQQLVSHLGLGRFGVMSWGGGSAFALALAHQLADRCTFAALLDPVEQPSRLTGNRLLRRFFTLGLGTLLSVRKTGDLARYFRRWREQLSDQERKYLDEEQVGSLLASISAEALRQGAAGVAQDIWLGSGGCKPVDHRLSVPVHVWSARTSVLDEGERLARHSIRGHKQLLAGHIVSQVFEVLRASQRQSAVSPDRGDRQRR
ncbi:MAG TPA: alpha/beta hydrolase [Pseudohongiella sp.]|nr:alpha/beta hydrolase [Pseudohongiella sp.]